MEEKKITREYNFLKLIFFVVYFADSLFYSYTSLFLSSIGFEEGIIGTIASITTITYLIVNPIWNIFAKNSKRIKWMLFIIALCSGSFIAIYGNLSTIELIMLFTALLASFMAPFYTLLDGHAINFCKKNEKEYSNIRVFGSTSYIFGSAIGGFLIDMIGFKNLFFVSGFIFILGSVLILSLKPNTTKDKEEKRDFKAIFKNKWFFGYVIFYLFTATLNTVGDNFVSLLFCNIKGVSTTNYGLIAATIIAIEVVTLVILSKFCRKVNELYLLIFIGLAYFLKGLFLSFTSFPLYILIPAACLRGIAWGTLLFVHMKYLVKLVGIGNVTTAALVLVSFGGLFQFIGNNLFGYLFENLGYEFSYKIIAVLSLIPCVIFVISRFIYERKEILS